VKPRLRVLVPLRGKKPPPVRLFAREPLWRMFLVGRNGQMTYEASEGANNSVHWVEWGLKMKRMTEASVGADPWTVVQNKLHPAVAEADFTPLDLSYLRRK
jgi:hypothetical protein